MKTPPSTFYAVLLALVLVLGVGCVKKEEKVRREALDDVPTY